jgi:hypothetical protein
MEAVHEKLNLQVAFCLDGIIKKVRYTQNLSVVGPHIKGVFSLAHQLGPDKAPAAGEGVERARWEVFLQRTRLVSCLSCPVCCPVFWLAVFSGVLGSWGVKVGVM